MTTEELSSTALVNAAKAAFEADGNTFVGKVEGTHGKQRLFETSVGKVCIRTTRNRRIAFYPLKGGGWQTLSEADWMLLASVTEGGEVEVHLLPADKVREHFDAAFKSRTDGGASIRTDEVGMWIAIDKVDEGLYAAGSGMLRHGRKLGAVAPAPAVAEDDVAVLRARLRDAYAAKLGTSADNIEIAVTVKG